MRWRKKDREQSEMTEAKRAHAKAQEALEESQQRWEEIKQVRKSHQLAGDLFAAEVYDMLRDGKK